ncbi:putative cytochrome P450 6a14 [Blattella germanica]|nr:putative cytochrome P450 6a14 [Blattella germanica]
MTEVSWLLLLVSFSAGALAILYIYFQRVYKYWASKDVKYLQPIFPFGNCKNLILMQKSMGDVYEEHYASLIDNKFGGIYLLNRPQLIVRDPDLIRTILVKDFEYFHDHGFIHDETIDPLSGNLFMLEGEKWRNMRTKLSPTFTSGKMKIMFHTMAECGVELADYLKVPAKNQEMFEIKDVMAKYTTDVIASCAFGIKCNCLKNPDAEFRQWGRRLTELSLGTIVVNILYITVPKIAIKMKIPSMPKDTTAFFRGLVHDTVRYREKNFITRKDFLQLLIQLKNQGYVDGPDELTNTTNGITMDEMAAQVFVFFVAGFETSSTTMSFCLYELALNHKIQTRLRIEIDTVLAKYDGKVTYEAIQEMTYLDKVISETLRKYPPVSFLARVCTKNYKIPDTNVTIDKDTEIVIPTQALHYDPLYYYDPQKFDPERFNEKVKNKRHNYVYLPFGEGPRLCIGMRFGLMQTKIGLVSLLTNYEFHICHKTVIPLVKDPKQFITTSKGGIWLKIEKRTV